MERTSGDCAGLPKNRATLPQALCGADLAQVSGTYPQAYPLRLGATSFRAPCPFGASAGVLWQALAHQFREVARPDGQHLVVEVVTAVVQRHAAR